MSSIWPPWGILGWLLFSNLGGCLAFFHVYSALLGSISAPIAGPIGKVRGLAELFPKAFTSSFGTRKLKIRPLSLLIMGHHTLCQVEAHQADVCRVVGSVCYVHFPTHQAPGEALHRGGVPKGADWQPLYIDLFYAYTLVTPL